MAALGSSSDRHIMFVGALSGVGYRMISAAAGLVTLPIAARSLPAEDFALALVLLSLIALLPFADLGVGLSLMTLVPREKAPQRVSDLYATARTIAGLSAGALGVTLIPLVILLPQVAQALLANASVNARVALGIVIMSVCVGLMAGVEQRMVAACHRQASQYFALSLSAIVGAITATAFLLNGWGLAAYVGASTLVPQVWILAHCRWIVSHKIGIATRGWNLTCTRVLLGTGLVLTLQSAVLALSVQSDVAIVSALSGAVAAAPLALTIKVTAPIVMFQSTIVTPLWPIVARRMGVRDGPRARQLTAKVLVLSFAVGGMLATILVFGGGYLADAISANTIQIPREYWLAAASWVIVMSIQNPLAMYVNATGAPRLQLISSLLLFCFNLPLTVVLVQTLGGWGATLATVLSFIACKLLPYTRFVFVSNRDAETVNA